MKKTFALALAMVFMLGMCSSVAFAQSDDPITLVVVQKYGSDGRDALVQQLVYDAGYNYKLEFINTDDGNAYEEKIQLMYQTGQQIDLLLDIGICAPDFIDSGLVVDLSDYCAEWGDFPLLDQGLIGMCTAYDGKCYSIPIEKFQRILFYRCDWLAELGYDHAPETWAELYEMSEALMAADSTRFGYSFRGAQGTASMFEQTVLGKLDPNIIDPINSWVTTTGYSIADDRFKDLFHEALREFKYQYTNLAPPDAITWGYPEMVEGFYSGTTCFLIQTAEVIDTCSSYMVEGTWDTAKLPLDANGFAYNSVSAGGLSIVSSTLYQDDVWNVIMAVGGYEGSKQFAEFYGTTPMYAYEEFGNRYYNAYSDIVANSDTQLSVTNGTNFTVADREYMSDTGINLDIVLQEYVSGQIDEENARQQMLTLYAWVDSSEWCLARRAAAE